jgi:hypothetical protein
MTSRSDRFIIRFATLFLCVLLAMFALFHFMRANDGRAIEQSAFRFTNEQGVLNFSEAFRVNLLLIDLALILILECVVIFIFVRYTAPALLISSALVIVLVVAGRGLLEREAVQRLFIHFVRNEYAALRLRDIVLLFVLNGLLLAFLVGMMHHYQQLELHEQAARSRAEPDGAAEPARAAEPPRERPAGTPPSQV